MTLQGLHLQSLSLGGYSPRQAFQRDVNVHWRDSNIIFIPRFPTVKWRCQHCMDWNPCSVQAWCPEAVATVEFTRLCIVLTVGGALYREQISIAPQRTLTEAKLYCGKIKPNYFYNSLEVCYSFRGCDICNIFTEGCSQCQSVGEHFYLLEKKPSYMISLSFMPLEQHQKGFLYK